MGVERDILLTASEPQRSPLETDDPLTPQDAGIFFQRWVCEAFRLSADGGSGVVVQHAFTVPTNDGGRTQEEIDGLVVKGWQPFLIQCKLEQHPTAFDAIARFHLQVERRPLGTLGLFFSRDYSDAALELRPMRVMLFRAVEIATAMEIALNKGGDFSMMKLVKAKWLNAVKLARPDAYASPDALLPN